MLHSFTESLENIGVHNMNIPGTNRIWCYFPGNCARDKLSIFLNWKSLSKFSFSVKEQGCPFRQDIFSLFYQVSFSFQFPGQLKMARMVPIFKKENAEEWSNYKQTSILSTMSKIFDAPIKNRIGRILLQRRSF